MTRTTSEFLRPGGRFNVLICDSCELPMAVWVGHTMAIPAGDAVDMEDVLRKVGR